ncbi:hypothetical protein PBI_SCTP2_459 [Salicola phage SCTP-2]|nr:hypothetical protein PBI_SCTP2_459 [Salicola phage SCTP-2]
MKINDFTSTKLFEDEGKYTKNTMFTPPKAAQENAKKALNYRKKYGDEVKGGTRVGWTRANQLANGEKISYDIVTRMSQFARHRKNAEISDDLKGEPWKDNGYIAWLIWGGDEGVEWAQRMVDKVENNEN